MSFHEVQFPTGISYGSKGGPGHNTLITELDSGMEERISRWSTTRNVYDVGYGVKSYAELGEVIKFARARDGATHGFRFKDWTDYTSTSDGTLKNASVSHLDVSIGTGDGVTTEFQLVKTYTSGGITKNRLINKPVSGTVKIGVGGTNTLSGWSVNTTTGIVTFTSAPSIGQAITAGFEFDVPVRFGKDVDDLLEISADDFSSGSVGRITVVEIKNPTPADEDFLFGGAQAFDPMSANTSITPGDGRVLTFNPSTSGLWVTLPDPSTYATGGPYFYIGNLSLTTTIDVRRSGTLILTVPAASWVTVVLGYDGFGVKTWYAF